MKNKAILIIEDDLEIRTLIQFFVEKDKTFSECTIITAQSGKNALSIIKDKKPDIIILDIMIPELNGIDVLKTIRNDVEKYGSPIIFMLTAKTEVEDIVTGFEYGCDDYLRKPFDPRELILRLKKLVSLKFDFYSKKNVENILYYKNIEVHIDKHIVIFDGNEIELSSKEFKLLSFLIKNKGIALSREKILNNVWDENYHLGDRTIDVYIGKLRDKIPIFSNYIKTIKGVGYQLKDN